MRLYLMEKLLIQVWCLTYLLSVAHFVYLDAKLCERITYSLGFA